MHCIMLHLTNKIKINEINRNSSVKADSEMKWRFFSIESMQGKYKLSKQLGKTGQSSALICINELNNTET